MLHQRITSGNYMIYASHKSPHNSLVEISKAKAERILLRLVNLTDVPPEGTRITSRTPHIASVADFLKTNRDTFPHCSQGDLFALRHLLREAWMSSNPARREWFVFLLRNYFSESAEREQSRKDGTKLIETWGNKRDQIEWILEKSEKSPFPIADLLSYFIETEQVSKAYKESLPTETQFERVAFFLQRQLHRARRCLNVECPSPFFFKRKRAQTYCTKECADEADRQRKRNWWNINRGKKKRRS
jgi:hypothetical protein